jgi:hypothetical protein
MRRKMRDDHVTPAGTVTLSEQLNAPFRHSVRTFMNKRSVGDKS